jgi:hypothetical protein
MSRSVTRRMRQVDDGVLVSASGFKIVPEFDYWLSQFVGLVPRDEYRLVIYDYVHRIPNDFRIADSARTAIVLSQGRLSFRRGRA